MWCRLKKSCSKSPSGLFNWWLSEVPPDLKHCVSSPFPLSTPHDLRGVLSDYSSLATNNHQRGRLSIPPLFINHHSATLSSSLQFVVLISSDNIYLYSDKEAYELCATKLCGEPCYLLIHLSKVVSTATIMLWYRLSYRQQRTLPILYRIY